MFLLLSQTGKETTQRNRFPTHPRKGERRSKNNLHFELLHGQGFSEFFCHIFQIIIGKIVRILSNFRHSNLAWHFFSSKFFFVGEFLGE